MDWRRGLNKRKEWKKLRLGLGPEPCRAVFLGRGRGEVQLELNSAAHTSEESISNIVVSVERA